jgi:hypothetical protein
MYWPRSFCPKCLKSRKTFAFVAPAGIFFNVKIPLAVVIEKDANNYFEQILFRGFNENLKMERRFVTSPVNRADKRLEPKKWSK